MAATRFAQNPEEVSRLLREALPGDRIELAASSFSGSRWTWQGNGKAGAPITIAAARPGATYFTGRPHLSIDGEFLNLEGFHFTQGAQLRISGRSHALRDLAIVEGAEPLSSDSKWISLYGREHLLERCYLAGKRNPGATLVVWLAPEQSSGHHTIRQNHFGPRPPLGQNGGETIRVGDSQTSLQSAHCRIEANLFTACDGEIEIISNKSCGNTYRGNTFRACAGTLTLRHGNACRVTENIFLGEGKTGTGGIRIIGEDHWVENNVMIGLRGTGARAALSLVKGVVDTPLNGYAQVRRAIVTANEIRDCKEAIARSVDARGATLEPEGCWVESNLIDSPTRLGLEPLRPQDVGPLWQK